MFTKIVSVKNCLIFFIYITPFFSLLLYYKSKFLYNIIPCQIFFTNFLKWLLFTCGFLTVWSKSKIESKIFVFCKSLTVKNLQRMNRFQFFRFIHRLFNRSLDIKYDAQQRTKAVDHTWMSYRTWCSYIRLFFTRKRAKAIFVQWKILLFIFLLLV